MEMNEFHLVEWWTLNKEPREELEQFKMSEYRPERMSRKYLSKLNVLLANLLQASRTNSAVIYGRRSQDCQMTIKLVDWLVGTGRANGVIGIKNSFTKKSSTVWLSNKSIYKLQSKKIAVSLNTNKAFIILRDKDKKCVKLPARSQLLKSLNEPAYQHNKLWLKAEATFEDGSPVIPFVYRVFNVDFKHGGRFYFHSQTEKKSAREGIKIDGEETVELDYKALHFNLLYAMSNVQLNGDPYIIEGYSRKVIKLAMLSFINSENRSSWCGNITRSGNPELVKKAQKWKALPNNQKNSKWRKGFEGLIEGIPENTKGRELANAIDENHSYIKDLFHTTNIGLILQRKDSEIMSYCLTALAERGIPTLPYHDGIRCQVSKLLEVKEIMENSYKYCTGFSIIVD